MGNKQTVIDQNSLLGLGPNLKAELSEAFTTSTIVSTSDNLQWNCMTDSDEIFNRWVGSINSIREFKKDTTNTEVTNGIQISLDEKIPRPRMFFQDVEFQVLPNGTLPNGTTLNVRILRSKYPRLLQQNEKILQQLKKSKLKDSFHIPWNKPSYIYFRVTNATSLPISSVFHQGSIIVELHSVDVL